MQIDTSFDFRTDSSGRDPDSASPTLREYHRLLWSKPLPCGRLFQLETSRRNAYLYHKSELGEFVLASDSAIPSFTRWKSMQGVITQFPEEDNEAFRSIGYTIGGMIVFPGNRLEGKQTINGARGFNRKIADRLDLTLECIRRHYLSEESPLSSTLARYSNFFDLFNEFKSYVDFFFLQDLFDSDKSRIKFLMPFENFDSSSVPRNFDEYAEYRTKSVAFVHARNRRVDRAFNSSHAALAKVLPQPSNSP